MSPDFDLKAKSRELAEHLSKLVLIELDGVQRTPSRILPPGPESLAAIETALQAAIRSGQAAGLQAAIETAKTHAKLTRYRPPENRPRPLVEVLEDMAEQVRRG